MKLSQIILTPTFSYFIKPFILYFISQHIMVPADRLCLYSIASTLMHRHDVASTFIRRCINIMCLWGSHLRFLNLGSSGLSGKEIKLIVLACNILNFFLKLSLNGAYGLGSFIQAMYFTCSNYPQKVQSSRKHAYVILTPLNPTFI